MIIIVSTPHFWVCIKRSLIMTRMSTMWRLFSIILAIFVDKSFEICKSISTYEAVCYDEKIIRNQPLTLSGSEKILRIQTNTEIMPSGTFRLLPKLETLELTFNKITNIEAGAFQNLENLIELLLNINQLTNIENNVFDNCPKLKYLNLDHNKISTIEENAFNKLTQLERLILSHNQIEEMPKALKSLSGLQTLCLKRNNMVKLFTNSFTGMKSLKTLILHANLIKEIENDAFKGLTELKLLDISDNLLKDLDANNIADNLPKLETIKLEDNIFNCTTLKTIIETFKDKKINVGRGYSESNTAVNGIDCIN